MKCSTTGYEMTKEKIELLCKISDDINAIRNGNLHEWQIEILNQYDYAMEYLTGKYPSYNFKIVNCEQKNKWNSYTTFTFTEESNEKNCYELYLYVDEDAEHKYDAEDNFYGDLFDEEISQMVKELVQEEFPECIEVKTDIPYAQGEEYGESLDLERVLTGELQMGQVTTLFMNTEKKDNREYAKKVNELGDFINTKGICGSYAVKFVMGMRQEKVLYQDCIFGV